MKFPVSSAVLMFALMGTHAFAETALEPVGTWLTEDGRAKIRTEKCGADNAEICGYVVWMKDPLTEIGQPRTDTKNPDPAKRNRPSLGLELIEDLKADEDKHYTGEIYNAENGKKYDVTLTSEKASELQVKGCLMHYLCASQTWTKVADLPVPTPNKVVQNTPKKTPSAPLGQHPHDNQAGQTGQ